MAKQILITGATSGIGLEVALRLNEAGWKVFATGLQSDDFGVLPYPIVKMPLDLGDEDSIEGVVKLMQTESDSKLDALVNNAAMNLPSTLEGLPIRKLWRQFDVNVFGQLHLIQEMLPMLRQTDNPRIVNVSSLMGQVAMPLLGPYSMSKHAFNAMTEALRIELAPQGIHVSLVSLSAIETPMTREIADMLHKAYSESPEAIRETYNDMFDGMIETLQQQAENPVPVEKAADAIIKAVTSKNPRARYAVGTDMKALIALKNLLPNGMFESILKRSLNLS